MHHDDQISLWVSPVAVQALIQGPLSHADRKQDRNALAKPPKQFSKRLREAQWSRQKCLSCAGWGRTPRCQQRLVCHKELLLDAAGDIDLACYERTAKLSSGRSATLIALIIAPDAALRGLFILGYQYIYIWQRYNSLGSSTNHWLSALAIPENLQIYMLPELVVKLKRTNRFLTDVLQHLFAADMQDWSIWCQRHLKTAQLMARERAIAAASHKSAAKCLGFTE